MADAKKASGDEAAGSGIQCEEDLQRMIEQEAWYESDDDQRLETDADETEPDQSFYYSEVIMQMAGGCNYESLID